MDPQTAPASSPTAKPKIGWRLTPVRIVFAVLFAVVGLGGFFLPGLEVVRSIFDPALNGPGMPRMARRMHLSLAPRYAAWATKRVTKGKVANALDDVSGTEWPLYGSVFYLLAEEQIQAAWEKDHSLFRQEPRVFAREAIEAAARLVADPQHATWVRKYWGDAYLEKENVFYRMLLISALASHRNLTGSDEFAALLRQQADGLAAALDASPSGLLDDYPGACYPTDVLSAWGAIHRADAALGMDHSQQIARAVRAFTGPRATREGLPPYAALARTGEPLGEARGCSNSNACVQALDLWPETGRAWYSAYERAFWQSDWLASGFREYAIGSPHPAWSLDVDSGPVVRGNGFAACSFGIAAARMNGRFDHAYPLSLEAIALGWPLPFGRLLLPRMVSDATDAPLIGEAAVLLHLSTAPSPAAPAFRYHTGTIPGVVFVWLFLYFGVAYLFFRRAWWTVRSSKV